MFIEARAFSTDLDFTALERTITRMYPRDDGAFEEDSTDQVRIPDNSYYETLTACRA